MKFVLDENIGQRGQELLRASGHDAKTLAEQRLDGAQDELIYWDCASEGRVLVTLDHEFSQTLRFAPEQTAGIVVLASSPRATQAAVLKRLREMLALLNTRSVAGELWIVEPGRVRVHERVED